MLRTLEEMTELVQSITHDLDLEDNELGFYDTLTDLCMSVGNCFQNQEQKGKILSEMKDLMYFKLQEFMQIQPEKEVSS